MIKTWKVEKKCKTCGKKFLTFPSQDCKFCSKPCYHQSLKLPFKVCPTCGYSYRRKGKGVVRTSYRKHRNETV